MPGIGLDKLEKAAELLARCFYGLIFLALVVLLFGSAGWAFLLLVLGACAHVGRAACDEFVAQQRGRDRRSIKLGA